MGENGENCIIDENYDELNLDEFSNIDSSLVLSLIEDARAEDVDDETMRLIIESLEPKIANGCSSSEASISEDEYRFREDGEVESCSSTSPGFEWDDDMEMMAYFVSEDEGFEDYSQVWYDEMPMAMEEDDCINIGLWQ